MQSVSAFTRHAAAIVILAAAALPGVVAAQTSPLIGTWNFQPDKSTFMPGPARVKSMTITITDPNVMNVDGVDGNGRALKGTYQASVDGAQHPITGFTTYDSGIWTKNSDSVAGYKYQKGKTIVTLGTRSLSADHSTLTFREQVYDANGKFLTTSVMVFRNPEVAVVVPPPPPPVNAAPAAPQVASGPSPDELAGTAALEKGDADAAIAAFTKALEKDSKGPSAVYDYVSRGVAYAKKMDNQKALADFDAAVKLKPDDTDALFRRGSTRLALEQYPGAIEDFTAVIKADDMHALAYRLRGFIYNKQGDDKSAGADYDKACALNKEYCL